MRIRDLSSDVCSSDLSLVDLMRYRPDAPRGAMDFLFANTLTHLQSLGYQNFGLGMAPMSGMIDHPLASRWHRFGRLLFAHGEQFYNFQGLRDRKSTRLNSSH